MATTTTVKTGQAGLLEMPQGATLELNLTVTGLSLSGKTVYFAIRSHGNGPIFACNSDDDPELIDVNAGAGTIEIAIPPNTEDEEGVVCGDVCQGRTRYRVDISSPCEVRVQGDITFIQEEGAWR